MLEAYRKHAEDRRQRGVPPLPLNPEQTRRVCDMLLEPPKGEQDFLLELLEQRVPPGVDEAAQIKADFLGRVAREEVDCPALTPEQAVELLGTMRGGFNVPHLIEALGSEPLADRAAKALAHTIFIFDELEQVKRLADQGNPAARRVIDAWAAAEWFKEAPQVPEEVEAVVFKVDGEINTDDLSPAGHATTRPDIPLHALAMGEKRFPGGIDEIHRLRSETDLPVAFVGDVVGTGSSRKSACNSLIWHIGEDIPYVPNKRRGGIILGGVIAPIFFNTAEDSGALPIQCDVSGLKTGQRIRLRPHEGRLLDEQGGLIAGFEVKPPSLIDEYRAGGRVPLIAGKQLTGRVREMLELGPIDLFVSPPVVQHEGIGFSLAQKIVGKACGMEGVHPGTACLPKMTSVGSQDTTGPMTRDEIKELACLKFQGDLVMQSFCHTAAYPTDVDEQMHATLPGFIEERGGVALEPGDGVIHSWLNRMVLPDTVGTGGDSHTRFPMGVSFPAGSGLVAFAGALGFMPLEMPESVLVKLNGERRHGITLRDVVNAIPWVAIQKGLLTVEKQNKKNVFNGRILEIEGMPDLTVEQGFELTDASAERSAAASTIALSEDSVADFLRSNVSLLESLIEDGYSDADTLRQRIEQMKRWLENPSLLRRDGKAAFAEELDIDLSTIDQPIVACPNDPDDVRKLSEIAGARIDEVFIGSCMVNIGHFRAAARMVEGVDQLQAKLWLAPPTRMDRDHLAQEGVLARFEGLGARIELPGCSLCMGNQARVEDNAVVFSTSTRNFDNRMGDGAQVYLGSAELAALCAVLGRIPTPEEYFQAYEKSVAPHEAEVYRYLEFDRMPPRPNA
jgi:aconitate hydratase 2/2-methylisocitrate dehydratase